VSAWANEGKRTGGAEKGREGGREGEGIRGKRFEKPARRGKDGEGEICGIGIHRVAARGGIDEGKTVNIDTDRGNY
jgi:hypothetical protein